MILNLKKGEVVALIGERIEIFDKQMSIILKYLELLVKKQDRKTCKEAFSRIIR